MYSGKQFFKQIKIVFIFFVVFLNCDILAEDIGDVSADLYRFPGPRLSNLQRYE